MIHPPAIAVAQDAVYVQAARIGALVHFDTIVSGYTAFVWRVFAMPDGEEHAAVALAEWLEANGWRRSSMGPGTFERAILVDT